MYKKKKKNKKKKKMIKSFFVFIQKNKKNFAQSMFIRLHVVLGGYIEINYMLIEFIVAKGINNY